MIPAAQVKVNLIKSKNREAMKVLEDVLDPEVLHTRVPHLAETDEARRMYKQKLDMIYQLGKFQNEATGFTKDRNLQYVANVDHSIWAAVLDVFAKHDPTTGDFIDDGLLYKYDPNRGCVVLNKDFFYALLAGPLKRFDMRGKVSII